MSYLLMTFLSLIICFCLDAKDFGIRGNVFSIEEEDLLEVIKRRLSQINFVEEIPTVKPIAIKIADAKKYRKFYFDPSICAQEDIKDLEGKIIVKKGQHYNPMHQFVWKDDLIFFDGTNPKHVDWAKEQYGKWILVRGNPIELENQENRSVYFDQFGYLVGRLGIQAIPAKVSQEGLKLKIEEFNLLTR